MPDRKTIEIVQEVVGAALITKRSREMTRALVLTGPSNTGKSGVIATIAGFLCEDPNTTPFDLLENNSHGTADFLRPVPWVLHEAFDAKWHFSATAKALLSGDPIQVNVKNGPLISHQFRQGVFWATNLPPQFKEQSRALEHRILIVRMHRTFDPEKPIGALLEAHKRGHRGIAEFVLAEERSGLLNWALAGLKRLRQRGYFLETKEMLDAKHEMHLEHNLAVAMVEDMVEFDSDCMVSVPNFCAAFTSWWRDNRGEKVPVADAIGRALRLLDERIGVDRKQLRGHSKRFYAGVRLNDDGLMAWQQYCTWGDGHIATDRDVNEVNIPIPRQWYGKDIIKRIRKAHGK
jgi:phage/plasmid-associated DNA primase